MACKNYLRPGLTGPAKRNHANYIPTNVLDSSNCTDKVAYCQNPGNSVEEKQKALHNSLSDAPTKVSYSLNYNGNSLPVNSSFGTVVDVRSEKLQQDTIGASLRSSSSYSGPINCRTSSDNDCKCLDEVFEDAMDEDDLLKARVILCFYLCCQ